MDLDALHLELSKDEAYVRAYEELGDSIALAMHCRTVREEHGLTQAELAARAGVSASAVSRFEQLRGAAEPVVGAIVRQLNPWLRERGVQTEHWMRIAPQPPARLEAGKRRTKVVESAAA
jgi:predicted transcriptional regulator